MNLQVEITDRHSKATCHREDLHIQAALYRFVHEYRNDNRAYKVTGTDGIKYFAAFYKTGECEQFMMTEINESQYENARLNDEKSFERLYLIPRNPKKLLISLPVIEVFEKYQMNGAEPMAGGLLFARFGESEIEIQYASEPDETDVRSLDGFVACRESKKEILQKQFEKGLHFIGEWHTSESMLPSPSDIDCKSMRESFIESRHELNNFVLIVAGSSRHPKIPLSVTMHNDVNIEGLIEEKISKRAPKLG